MDKWMTKNGFDLHASYVHGHVGVAHSGDGKTLCHKNSIIEDGPWNMT
jgi:hypothetical protein